MQSKKHFFVLAIVTALVGFSTASLAFAQTNPQGGGGRFGRGAMNPAQAPAVVGTVASINGNSLTVNGRQGFNNTAPTTTFSVDATNAKVTKGNTASTIGSIVAGDTVMVQGTVSGTNITATAIRDGVMMGRGPGGNGMGIGGTVASIGGTTLTVTGRATANGGTAPTYTVDASSATVTKNGATSTVSSIAVGDTVMVQGTVGGTSVVAKTIRDGVGPQNQPVIQGNGQPVVAGSVVSNDNTGTIIIKNNSNVSYTINTSSGTKFVVKGVTSPTISSVAVGDNLVVQGAVSGNVVTASSVIDQKTGTNNNPGNHGEKPKANPGFFEGIGSFFKRLFGF